MYLNQDNFKPLTSKNSDNSVVTLIFLLQGPGPKSVPAYASPMRSTDPHVNSQWAASPLQSRTSHFAFILLSLCSILSACKPLCAQPFSHCWCNGRGVKDCLFSMHYEVGWVGFAGLKSAGWKWLWTTWSKSLAPQCPISSTIWGGESPMGRTYLSPLTMEWP